MELNLFLVLQKGVKEMLLNKTSLLKELKVEIVDLEFEGNI